MAKIVNINPIEQLKKDEMARVLALLQAIDLSKLNGFFLAIEYDGVYEAHLIGMDFGLKGYIQTHLNLLGEELLAANSDTEDGLTDLS